MAANVEEAVFRVGPFVVPLSPWSSEHFVDGSEGTDGASLKVSGDRSEDQRWLSYAIGRKHVCKRTTKLKTQRIPLFQEIKKAIDTHAKTTRAGTRTHRRDLVNPIECFVSVRVRGRKISVRNTRKYIAIWIKKEGNEGRETIQWLIDQLASECNADAEDDHPSDVDSELSDDAGCTEEKHKKALIKELLEDPLCEKLSWLPSRAAFHLKVKGRIQKVEVHLRQYARLKRDIDAGGPFNVLRERYNEAKDKLEEHLRNAAHAMDEGPPQGEPRDAGEHLQVPHPPTPPPGASGDSEGGCTDGSM